MGNNSIGASFTWVYLTFPWAQGTQTPLQTACQVILTEALPAHGCYHSKCTNQDGVTQLSSVQLLSHVRLSATPWTAARQASRSFTNSRSLIKLMSIASVMPPNHLIPCHPLLFLPSTFPSITVFFRVSSLHQVAKILERLSIPLNSHLHAIINK